MTTFDSKKYYVFGEKTHFKDYFGTDICIGDSIIVPDGYNSLYTTQVLSYSNATINGSLYSSQMIIHKSNDDPLFTTQRLKVYNEHFDKYPESHKRISLALNSKSFVILMSDNKDVLTTTGNGSLDNLFVYKTTIKYKTVSDLSKQLNIITNAASGFHRIGYVNGKGQLIDPSTPTSASSTLTYLNGGLFGLMPIDTPIAFKDFLRAVEKITNNTVYNLDRLHPNLKRMGDYYYNSTTPVALRGVLSYADI